MSTTILQQILSEDCYWPLLVDNKCNFSNTFKLKPIITYHIRFIVKVLQKYRGHDTSLPTNTSKVQILVN